MNNDINGVSQCPVGGENVAPFLVGRGRNKKRYLQYDYRHEDFGLFSCVRRTIEECRDRRDRWLLDNIQHREFMISVEEEIADRKNETDPKFLGNYA
jgi:hypothetical protein